MTIESYFTDMMREFGFKDKITIGGIGRMVIVRGRARRILATGTHDFNNGTLTLLVSRGEHRGFHRFVLPKELYER